MRRAAWVLMLSLLCLGMAAPPHACAGACCVPGPGGVHGSHEAIRSAPMEHACCCGGAEERSCDLEEAPVPQGLDSALSATPRVEVPSQAFAVLNPDAKGPVAACAGRIARVAPTAQAPPGPIYLRYLSILC